MVQTDDLANIDSKLIDEANIIGVDEAHFFKSLAAVVDWVDNKHKTVVVASLDGDSNRKPFGDIYSLMPYADKVQKLDAYCVNCSQQKNKTFESAIFTYKTSASKEVIDVGALDKYISVCRSCYLQLKQKE
jgi:thymidine kinase